jgi:hypothetical protein
MNTSKYIARLMGPVLLIIGIGMALGLVMETDYSSLMKEFIGNRAVIFLTGILALLAGVAIVNEHNLWVPDWRLIITILGWLFVVRGIMLLVFPAVVPTVGEHIVASGRGVLAGAAVNFVLGAILSIMGYEHLWAEKPRRVTRAAPSRAAPAKAASRTRRAKAKRPRRKRRS